MKETWHVDIFSQQQRQMMEELLTKIANSDDMQLEDILPTTVSGVIGAVVWSETKEIE